VDNHVDNSPPVARPSVAGMTVPTPPLGGARMIRQTISAPYDGGIVIYSPWRASVIDSACARLNAAVSRHYRVPVYWREERVSRSGGHARESSTIRRMSMKEIDKYMIPLDSILSADAGCITAMIFVAVVIGGLAAIIVAGIVYGVIYRVKDVVITTTAVTAAIITAAIAYCLMAHVGLDKSIDTSKINNEYGITVTSMDYAYKQDGIETHRMSYLRDGDLVNGTMLIKDGKVGLFAGKGDKLTPVKPKSVADTSAAPTTSKTTDSDSHVDVRAK
jgi:hypothetical protein